jgi:1,4-alpha-glucan branching enzyme
MGAEYPKVHADLSVTFRIKAPDAKKVQVDLGKLWDMERDSEGVWSVTIPPQVPGFHYYYLNIDGVRVSDPASQNFYGVSRESSGIEIPEAGVLADAAAFNKRVKLVWIGIGTKEPERMYASVHSFHETLTQAGIEHVYYESPGTSHEWLTWRRDLYEFAPRLFR